MASINHYPETREISYYRGNTFGLVDPITERLNGEDVPTDLLLPGNISFEAHIKVNPYIDEPDVIIPTEDFTLGTTEYDRTTIQDGVEVTETVNVSNIIMIESPPERFDNLEPVGKAYMDVFQYYYSGGKLKHRCLRRYKLKLTLNITEREVAAK